jgi:cytochrome c oxidase assembly protein subunit 15
MSPARYRAVCVFALAVECIIVVSGALVRLTGSGLGCDDWPNCNDAKFIDVSSKHAAIEQINRLFTGLVSVSVILAVLGAFLRTPRRKDLMWLASGLVAGVLGQIVLGGITVLVDLHPVAVQSHFLLSIVLVANSVALVHRAGQPDGPRHSTVSAATRRDVWVLAGVSLVAIGLGTVLTGAGPHAGDEEARRFDIAIVTAARMHSIAVWVSVAAAAWLLWRLVHRPADRRVLETPAVAWVCVAIAQGLIGYIQYFSGVPVVLAALHIAGATALWSITVWMVVVMTSSSPVPSLGEPLEERDELVDHV